MAGTTEQCPQFATNRLPLHGQLAAMLNSKQVASRPSSQPDLNSMLSRGRYSTHSSRSTQLSTAGFQPMSSAFTKMTPPRDTVAGEQWFMWLISSSRRMEEVRGMRSLEASVSICGSEREGGAQ